MKIEVLHIDDCVNWVETVSRVRSALDACDMPGVEIEPRLLLTDADTARMPFAGSPTVLIDGVDAFPSDGPIDCLACRIYNTEAGLAGAPTVEQLIGVIRQKSVATA